MLRTYGTGGRITNPEQCLRRAESTERDIDRIFRHRDRHSAHARRVGAIPAGQRNQRAVRAEGPDLEGLNTLAPFRFSSSEEALDLMVMTFDRGGLARAAGLARAVANPGSAPAPAGGGGTATSTVR